MPKRRDEMLCIFTGITPLMPNSKFCNFITSLKMIKTPRNFVRRVFPYEINNNNNNNNGRKHGWNFDLTSLLKSDPHLPKKIVLFPSLKKSFKNDQNCFLFHLKSYFRSQDISVFVKTFSSFGKSGLIRKTRLTSKFMASQPG